MFLNRIPYQQMFLCAAYWAVYFKVLPRLRGYTIVEKT